MKVQRSVVIEAPKEKVWPFLVQPDKIMEWYAPMRRFEYRGEQRAGVGTTIYAEERVAGRPRRLNFVVTDWADKEKIAFKMTSGEYLQGYEEKWMLETTPAGTRFTVAEDAKLPHGVLGNVMGVFARRSSSASMGTMLSRLKGFAEES